MKRGWILLGGAAVLGGFGLVIAFQDDPVPLGSWSGLSAIFT
jgi:hypothetical protein